MEASISGYVRRHHLGLVAIFIALTGTAWAGTKVTSQDIQKNAVRAKHVKDGKIGTKEIADGTTAAGLTGADVVPNSLNGGDVDEQTLYNDNSLDAGDIADNGSVGTAEVDESTLYNDDSLDADDIANSSSLGTAEVGEGDLFNDDSLAAADIAANGVGADEIAANAVGATEVANNTIGSDEILDFGSVEARLAGDFLTGRPASASDPETAFFQVSDEFVSVGRSTVGGSTVGFSFNADTLETTFNDVVDIDDDFLELDEIADPGTNPPANTSWIYLRENAGSELVVEFNSGLIVPLAAD
jgi:hypothetical protein